MYGIQISRGHNQEGIGSFGQHQRSIQRCLPAHRLPFQVVKLREVLFVIVAVGGGVVEVFEEAGEVGEILADLTLSVKSYWRSISR